MQPRIKPTAVPCPAVRPWAAPAAPSHPAPSAVLVADLQRLAGGLELVAAGDLVQLSASGFALKKKGVRSTAPLPAPENLRVKPTGISGEAGLKCKAVPRADIYEVAYTRDPTTGPWTSLPGFTNSQAMLVTGLERGKDYYFRVRAIGANGPGAWSDVATMMVV